MSENQALLDRLNKLENEVNDLKLSNNKSNDSELNEIKGKKQKKEKVDKPKRKQSEYNLFMGEYISNKKKELGDLYNHKKVFADGAKLWSEKKN